MRPFNASFGIWIGLFRNVTYRKYRGKPASPYFVQEVDHKKYRAFRRFGQAKFAYGGLLLGSSQFSILPQLPQKMMLASKVIRIDSKIIISLH